LWSGVGRLEREDVNEGEIYCIYSGGSGAAMLFFSCSMEEKRRGDSKVREGILMFSGGRGIFPVV
jgi:3-hydroxy-3-methylglutaryl CoA synthase